MKILIYANYLAVYEGNFISSLKVLENKFRENVQIYRKYANLQKICKFVENMQICRKYANLQKINLEKNMQICSK